MPMRRRNTLSYRQFNNQKLLPIRSPPA